MCCHKPIHFVLHTVAYCQQSHIITAHYREWYQPKNHMHSFQHKHASLILNTVIICSSIMQMRHITVLWTLWNSIHKTATAQLLPTQLCKYNLILTTNALKCIKQCILLAIQCLNAYNNTQCTHTNHQSKRSHYILLPGTLSNADHVHNWTYGHNWTYSVLTLQWSNH